MEKEGEGGQGQLLKWIVLCLASLDGMENCVNCKDATISVAGKLKLFSFLKLYFLHDSPPIVDDVHLLQGIEYHHHRNTNRNKIDGETTTDYVNGAMSGQTRVETYFSKVEVTVPLDGKCHRDGLQNLLPPNESEIDNTILGHEGFCEMVTVLDREGNEVTMYLTDKDVVTPHSRLSNL